MSISSLEANPNHQQSAIFSFGAPDSKSFSPFSPQCHSIRAKDSKLGFVLEMIQKYELKQNTNKLLSTVTIDPIDLHREPITRKLNDSRFLSYLSTSRHLNTSNDEEDSESINDSEQQYLSDFKSQLQETHQNILNKYITPIRLIDHSDAQLLSNQYEEENNISQFINPSDQKIQQSQLVDRNSVPLVESLIMPNPQELSTKYLKQLNQQVQQQGNEVDSKQSESKRNSYERKRNETKVKETSSMIEGDLKISQLFAFCLIVLAILLWKI